MIYKSIRGHSWEKYRLCSLSKCSNIISSSITFEDSTIICNLICWSNSSLEFKYNIFYAYFPFKDNLHSLQSQSSQTDSFSKASNTAKSSSQTWGHPNQLLRHLQVFLGHLNDTTFIYFIIWTFRQLFKIKVLIQFGPANLALIAQARIIPKICFLFINGKLHCKNMHKALVKRKTLSA